MIKQFMESTKRHQTVRKLMTRYRSRSLRRSDVLLASYPRSGNTWMKFMLAELMSGDRVDFDTSERHVPSLEDLGPRDGLLSDGGRLVKTHESFDLLRLGSNGAIYMVRDGRDVAVSEYFYSKRIGRFQGEFDDFLPMFLEGTLSHYGSWSNHVTSWLESGLPRLLVLRYEDILADPVGQLARTADFLGLPAFDSERLESAVANNAAGEMRSKEALSSSLQAEVKEAIPFVRSATSGDWENHFDEHLLSRFEREAGRVLDLLGYDRMHAAA